MRIPIHLDDHECVTRSQRGDRGAFSGLVARYQDRIYRFLVRLTRSEDDALELAQETFLRAYQKLADRRPEARFTTWLFLIARNLAFDLLRRNKRVEFLPLEEDDATVDPRPGPHATLETARHFRMLESALARVPLEHREILLLRGIEEMSNEDIAALLKLNQSAAKHKSKIELNAGKKWATDDPLRQAMNGIRTTAAATLPAAHSGKASDADYDAFGKEVTAQITYIVQNCKLDPKAEAQLHTVIEDMLEGVEIAEGKESGKKRASGVVKVLRAVNTYSKHFDHPGWKPVALPH